MDVKKGEITFTMGPISIHQFNMYADCGINALKILQYIKTEQGIEDSNGVLQFKDWFIKLDNGKFKKLFGVHSSHKWRTLKILERKNLIEIKRKGRGRAPMVKIKAPHKILN